MTVRGVSPHAGHRGRAPITTEAMIAELLKKAAGGLAMPPGDGMGGMDFQSRNANYGISAP